jgi:hypothetical protein
MIQPPVRPEVRVSSSISLICNSFLCLETEHSLVSQKIHASWVHTGRFPQILWSLQRSYLTIQSSVEPHAVWYVSYQLLSHSWHTDHDYGSYRLLSLEIGLVVGVTGQQGMLIPPRHLIPPLIYSEVRVHPFSDLYYEIDYCSLFLSWHLHGKTPFRKLHCYYSDLLCQYNLQSGQRLCGVFCINC